MELTDEVPVSDILKNYDWTRCGHTMPSRLGLIYFGIISASQEIVYGTI